MCTFLIVALWTSTSAYAGQGSSCSPQVSVVVPQRSYAQLNVPAFEQRVYVYAPDIKSGWGGDVSAFQLWIVEGVYGKPFVQAKGSMDVSAFEQIRTSRNVRAIPVRVDGKNNQNRAAVTIAKRQVSLELKVNTSFGGADSVLVSVCR
jgi:hypothetical protein